MIIADYHVHTDYSIDSNEPMEESIVSAIARGLTEIVFTDHLETLNRNEQIQDIIDYKKYIQEMDLLRDKYFDKIKIKLGAEINLESDLSEQYNACIEEYPFDFIIGSIHAVNFIDVGMPPYYGGLTVDEYHEKYYKNMMDTLRKEFRYSVLGHLDYIVRYGGYKNNIVNLDKQRQYIEPIMKKIISEGKGIELNTSGWRYKLKEFHPSKEILTLYHRLGGEIITIGSDSHRADTIAQDFDYAEKLLKEVGFKYYTIYERMKPHFIKLG